MDPLRFSGTTVLHTRSLNQAKRKQLFDALQQVPNTASLANESVEVFYHTAAPREQKLVKGETAPFQSFAKGMLLPDGTMMIRTKPQFERGVTDETERQQATQTDGHLAQQFLQYPQLVYTQTPRLFAPSNQADVMALTQTWYPQGADPLPRWQIDA